MHTKFLTMPGDAFFGVMAEFSPVHLFILNSTTCKHSKIEILIMVMIAGDQGYYSCSSEACQDHQKLNLLTPFPSFTT